MVVRRSKRLKQNSDRSVQSPQSGRHDLSSCLRPGTETGLGQFLSSQLGRRHRGEKSKPASFCMLSKDALRVSLRQVYGGDQQIDRLYSDKWGDYSANAVYQYVSRKNRGSSDRPILHAAESERNQGDNN